MKLLHKFFCANQLNNGQLIFSGSEDIVRAIKMAIDNVLDKTQQAFSWAKHFGQKVVQYAFAFLGELVSVIGKRIPLNVVNKIPGLNKLTSVSSQVQQAVTPKAMLMKVAVTTFTNAAISNIFIKLQNV